jgi:hypothetical protein
MRNELKGTSAAKIVDVQQNRKVPDAPSQLTITAVK